MNTRNWIAPKLKSKRFHKSTLMLVFVLVNIWLWSHLIQKGAEQTPTETQDIVEPNENLGNDMEQDREDIIEVEYDEEMPEKYIDKTPKKTPEKTEIKEEFMFKPSPQILPFKDKAVIALLTSDSSKSKQTDMYYLNTLSMLYALKFHPETKLNDDVEVVIIVTESISDEKREMLLHFGARLIVVNSMQFEGISEKNEQWKNCYTKLYMFKMDFYKEILYLDTDLTIIDKIDGLFAHLESVKKENPKEYYFGSAQDWGLSKGTFNAGMMLFEPSKEHFDRILENVKHTSQYDSTMMEQGLLNWYFQQDKGGPGKTAWRQVPTNYNCQWVSKRPTEELNQAKILHFKVWQEDVPPEVYKIWRNQLNRVLSYQNQTMNATDIEWVPESQQQYTTSLKKGTFGQKMEKPKEYKIAIYTLLAGNDVEKNYEVDRIIANRQRYIKKWDTIHFIQRKLDEGVQHPVWQKVYDAEKLIKEYDWVWFLDADAYIMNPDISLQELLSKYEQESSYETNLVIANDCNGFNAGSFFVRKSKWTADFIQKWKAMETREDYPNAEMWKEQAALTHLYQTNVNDAQKYIYVVPQRDINSYAGPYCGHGYMPGDFIVHSPGKGYNGVKTFMEEHQYKEV